MDTSQDRYGSVQKPSTETTQYRFTNGGRSGKSTRLGEDNEVVFLLLSHTCVSLEAIM